jgi:hypothetical protein
MVPFYLLESVQAEGVLVRKVNREPVFTRDVASTGKEQVVIIRYIHYGSQSEPRPGLSFFRCPGLVE